MGFMSLSDRLEKHIEDDDISPKEYILLATIALRGGKAAEEEIRSDYNEWVEEFGEPDWEKLRVWAKDKEMEFEIVRPVFEETMSKMVKCEDDGLRDAIIEDITSG